MRKKNKRIKSSFRSQSVLFYFILNVEDYKLDYFLTRDRKYSGLKF